MKQVSDQVFSEDEFSDKQGMMDRHYILNSSLILVVDHTQLKAQVGTRNEFSSSEKLLRPPNQQRHRYVTFIILDILEQGKGVDTF